MKKNIKELLKDKINVEKMEKLLKDYKEFVVQKYPANYGSFELNKEIIKQNNLEEVDKSNLINIKAFKTARAFFYYNPELFKDQDLVKLENNLYVNYKPHKFTERLPLFVEIPITDITDSNILFAKLDALFKSYHNSPQTIILVFKKVFIDKSLIINYMLKSNYRFSCSYKFDNHE